MNFWHQAPFFRLVIPLLAGIITAAFFPFLHPFSFFVIIFLSLLFILFSFSTVFNSRYNLRWVYGTCLSFLLYLSGFEITILNTENLLPRHYSAKYSPGDKIIAMVAEPTVSKEKSLKTILEIKAVIRDTCRYPANGKILAYFEKDSISELLQYGNYLVFCTSLSHIPPPQNPEEFNYKRFLSFHRVYQQVFLKPPSYLLFDSPPEKNLMGYAYRVRNYLMDIFEKYRIEGDEYSVASALMLGSREEIDPDLVQAFASAGALHVLSVSGLHVGVIFMVMTYLLVFLDKIKYGKIIKTIILLLGLWFYALLTGLSPSVVRAATMFSFVVIGQAGRRNTNIYNILSCSAFFLLLINPYLIMEVGFQLSFLAVIGIVFIQPKLSRLWHPYIPVAGIAGNWLIEQVWTITTISVAAQIATFPLGLLYFHQFPNYFLFSNLVVIPLSTIIIYCGVLLFLISPFETISGYIAIFFKSCIWLLNQSVLLVEKLPFSLLQGISINLLETWLIYILIGAVLAFLILQNVKYARISFFILIPLLSYQVFENHIQHNQKKFIVYNIKKTSAFDFIDGKTGLLLADSSLLHSESRLLFHIKHNWWQLGLNKNRLYDYKNTARLAGANLFMKEGFMLFCGKRIAFVKNRFPPMYPQHKIKVDYLVISGSPALSIKELKNIFDIKQIIIDASNSRYTAKKLLEEAKAENIACYPVSEMGAFVADL